jgi:hypothetical protein
MGAYYVGAFMSQNKLTPLNFEDHKEGLTRRREHKKKRAPLPPSKKIKNEEEESSQL